MKYALALRRMVFSGKVRVLDCGCGTGLFFEKVAGSVEFAVGVDLSTKMLDKAKLKLGQVSNIDLVCADIDFLPFSEGIFRYVFMFTVLPSHTDWAETINEALRVLGIHGMMILSVPKRETSIQQLLARLGMYGLELRELIDDATLDYVVISEETSYYHLSG